MKKIALLLLCTFSCVLYPQALDELKNYIMKSNIKGVKSILDITSLTEKTKIGLIDFANDIILMRLKSVEVFSYKNYSQENIAFIKEDIALIKEALSTSIHTEVNGKEEQAYMYNKWAYYLAYSFFPSIFSFMAGMKLLHDYSPNLIIENGKVVLTESHDLIGFFAFCLICLPFALLLGSIKLTQLCKEECASIMGKIRGNLKKNYEDAILIKQLIIDAKVSA